MSLAVFTADIHRQKPVWLLRLRRRGARLLRQFARDKNRQALAALDDDQLGSLSEIGQKVRREAQLTYCTKPHRQGEEKCRMPS